MFYRLGTVPLVALLACGGDNNSKPVDAAKQIDGLPSGCKAQSSYSTIATGGFGNDIPGAGSGSSATAHQQIVIEPLNTDDAFFLELNAQFGAFGSGDIKPGTYAIAGDDINYKTCGLCVQLWPQSLNGSQVAVDATYLENERYMATSGTVTLTAAGGGSGSILGGTVNNVAFQHVLIGTDRSQSTAADDCSSALGSGNFSVVLMAGSGT